MHYEIRNRPDFACLSATFEAGERLVTEPGARLGMTPGLKMETNMPGGFFAAAKRLVGGESVFQNTYTATASGQRLDLAPPMPGDMVRIDMAGAPVMVQGGCYVASDPGVTIDTKWGGLRSFASGVGFFVLRCEGTGPLFVSSYGAIQEIAVAGRYIVDTSHIVAFDGTLDYAVRSIGPAKSLFFSGEALVCEFSGKGRLWIQTRSATPLAAFLHPFRKVQPKSND